MRFFKSPAGRIVVFLDSAKDMQEAHRILQRGLNTLEPKPDDYTKLADVVQKNLSTTVVKP